MSDNTGGSTEPKPKPKSKGFSHPALRAMGIPTLRIPSRNWMIFWSVVGAFTGAYVYDRRERRRIRDEWKQKVDWMSKVPCDPMSMPRKITVYVAPPPGDYVDSTLTHFKHYIKPILTASATDFEVVSGKRQGELRYRVAESIRNKRRETLGLPTGENGDELEQRVNSKLTRDDTGGVICVGRGAYKEYMNGLHEGWLGPLEPPVEGEEAVATEEASAFPDRSLDLKDVQGEDVSKEREEKAKETPVPKPYTQLANWSDLPTNDEFARYAAQNEISQPLAAIGYRHILGFLNTPIRMYRFFNQRKIAEKVCSQTAAVVYAQTREAAPQDAASLIEEEGDWPKDWKKKGIENKSEWMAEFNIDERIRGTLTFYEDQPVGVQQPAQEADEHL